MYVEQMYNFLSFIVQESYAFEQDKYQKDIHIYILVYRGSELYVTVVFSLSMQNTEKCSKSNKSKRKSC